MFQVKDRLREKIVGLLPAHRAEGVLKFHDDHLSEILCARGSKENHQFWCGGYHDHILQCLVLGEHQFNWLVSSTKLGFVFSSAAIVFLFHGIEKIFKYGLQHTRYLKKEIEDKNIWYYGILPEKYGIYFEEGELNALEYIHGEHDYSGTERKMKPLAAFCHCIDVMSARIFFDCRRLKISETNQIVPCYDLET
jgi:hypothetical protein